MILRRVSGIRWRREWQSNPVFLSVKSHGERLLVGCSAWGCKELDTTEQLSISAYESAFLTTDLTVKEFVPRIASRRVQLKQVLVWR